MDNWHATFIPTDLPIDEPDTEFFMNELGFDWI